MNTIERLYMGPSQNSHGHPEIKDKPNNIYVLFSRCQQIDIHPTIDTDLYQM